MHAEVAAEGDAGVALNGAGWNGQRQLAHDDAHRMRGDDAGVVGGILELLRGDFDGGDAVALAAIPEPARQRAVHDGRSEDLDLRHFADQFVQRRGRGAVAGEEFVVERVNGRGGGGPVDDDVGVIFVAVEAVLLVRAERFVAKLL